MSNIFQRRFNGIRGKLFFSMVGILAVCFVVISIAAQPVLSKVLVFRTGNSLSRIADTIDSVAPGSSTYYFELYSIGVNNNISFELISPDGAINYQSSEGYSALSSGHMPSANNVESDYSQTERTASYRSSSGTYEKRRKIATMAEYLVFTREISTGETLHIFSNVAVIDSNVQVAARVFTLICILICLIMTVFVFYYAYRFTKPLVEMNDVTRDMAQLNFERRCGAEGPDEIGELGRSINVLSATLDATLDDLKDKNIQLGKELERRNEIDLARREFIGNVSHELKTPIAIISGYAEGLASGISDDPEVIKEYCSIINDESRKMTDLVSELLELSKLENVTLELNPATYSLGEQISAVANHFAILAGRRSIEIVNKVPEGIMCYAQPDKIEIVLKNYISNAVSHCNDGGRITIDCNELKDRYCVTVFNTGSSIGPEDIDRIWESFYRGDKSHNRSENRYGLGLSIVKAIMKTHGTDCYVRNVDGGVEFSFEVLKSI